MRALYTICLVLSLLPGAITAKPGISVEQVDCFPADDHGVISVQVENEPPAASVRIYFRRLHKKNTEDFYYAIAHSKGSGKYWGALPKPTKHKLCASDGRRCLRELAELWINHEISKNQGFPREWLRELDQEALRRKFEQFKLEPIEFYAGLMDAAGKMLARSDIKVAPVSEECVISLNEEQKGESQNLIVGETAVWQSRGKKKLFHWQCAGVVTRIDPQGIRRADVCRNRFIARWEEDHWSEEKKMRGSGSDNGKKPYQTVELFYGTDRKWNNPEKQSWNYLQDSKTSAYGVERGELAFGMLEVSIPVGHRKGQLEGLGLFEFKMDPEEHVTLQQVDPKARTQFILELQKRIGCPANKETDELSVCQDSGKAALVFVHGYNVSFEDAARRTAQIAFDLEFPGVPLLYSWPSQASISGYTVDEANIRWTVPHLESFFALLTEETQIKTVHIISHSMGNRAVTEVLRRFAAEKPKSHHPRFSQIVLVAPDIDAAVFRDEIAPAFAGVGERITLYASSYDKALNVSKGLHQYPRAGDLSEGVMIAKGVDTIDASDVDTSLLRAIRLGHSYYADKKCAIADLKATLAGKDANDRARKLVSFRPEGGGVYWKILGGETPWCR